MMARPIEILLIEDNPGDVFLTQTAFAESKIDNQIHLAEDGEQALAFLTACKNDVSRKAWPDLILLDLNLPKLDGRDVLSFIKQDELLRSIPVVILTSSEAEQDVVSSYNLHANSYIVKPLSLGQFTKVISAIENFWFSVVILPDR